MNIQDDVFLISANNSIQVLDNIDNFILQVREKVLVVGGAETEKERRQIITNAHKVTKTKTALGKIIDNEILKKREQIKPILLSIDELKDKKKTAEAKLSELSAELRNPVTAWELRESARVKAIDEKIKMITGYGEPNGSVKEMKETLWALEGLMINETYGERELEARREKDKAMNKLKEAVHLQEFKDTMEAQEKAERGAEAEKLRVEREEKIRLEAQEKAERDAKEKIELAEKLQKEAENRALNAIKAKEEAEAIAENQRVEAIERGRAQAEMAEEHARLEQERKQQEIENEKKIVEQEAAKIIEDRMKNAKLRDKVRRETIKALENYIDNGSTAELLFDAIEGNEIPHLSINYGD